MGRTGCWSISKGEHHPWVPIASPTDTQGSANHRSIPYPTHQERQFPWVGRGGNSGKARGNPDDAQIQKPPLAAPVSDAAQSSDRAPKTTFAPKMMGKGTNRLCPRRGGSNHRHGAVCRGSPKVKGRLDAAVTGVTLIDTCHLMGDVNVSPCSRRTGMSILSPCCHHTTGCHLGEGRGHKPAGGERQGKARLLQTALISLEDVSESCTGLEMSPIIIMSHS